MTTSSSSFFLVNYYWWSTMLLQSMICLPATCGAFFMDPPVRKSTALASSSPHHRYHHQQQHYHWIGDDASLISGHRKNSRPLMTAHVSLHQWTTTTAPFATSFSSSSAHQPPRTQARTQRAFRNHRDHDFETDMGSAFVQWNRIHAQAQQQQHNRRPRKFRVYCDLDGVLVDFCAGIQTLYKDGHTIQNVDDLHRRQMWNKVSQTKDFFANLPWLEQGKVLWETTVQHLEPIILTGVPVVPVESRQQKVDWCARELGISKVQHTDLAGPLFQHAPATGWRGFVYRMDPLSLATMTQRPPKKTSRSTNENTESSTSSSTSDNDQQPVCQVITCWSSQKHCESGPGHVLIDDRLDLKADWEAKGGIFIHHNGNAQDTIAQLRDHGILDEFLNEETEKDDDAVNKV